LLVLKAEEKVKLVKGVHNHAQKLCVSSNLKFLLAFMDKVQEEAEAYGV